MENTQIPSVQSPIPATSISSVPVAPVEPQSSKLPVITLSVLLLAALTGMIYLYLQNKSLQESINIPSTSVEPAAISQITTAPIQTGPGEDYVDGQIDERSGLETYTNPKSGFSIQYPSGWRMIQSENNGYMVGFGPKEMGEDILWAITVYPKTTTSVDSLKSEFGAQFPDRVEKTESAALPNGLTAKKVIVTTPSNPDWYSENIILENKDSYFVISNGAIKNESLSKMSSVAPGLTFEKFYTTFRFTN